MLYQIAILTISKIQRQTAMSESILKKQLQIRYFT